MLDDDESEEETIWIGGLDHAEVLHALYHGTRAYGEGVRHDNPHYSVADARADLAHARARDGDRACFDYVDGRPIKVIFAGLRLEQPWAYDRNAGTGAARRIVEHIRALRRLRGKARGLLLRLDAAAARRGMARS